MARDVDVERRLQSWARWRAGLKAGGLGYATLDLTTWTGSGDRYRESTIPTMDAEAAVTHQAVQALPSELRRTCEVVYLEGGAMEKKAARLVCAPSTVYTRIERIHVAVRMWLVERHRAAQEERRRVEALQRDAAGV
jgi:hypothetical protein